MPRMLKSERPQHLFTTMKRLFSYFKGMRAAFVVVVILVIYSSFANLFGTYYSGVVVINSLLEEQSLDLLISQCVTLGIIYLVGAISTFVYCQLMVRITQHVMYRVRLDLMKKIQVLPISYFDEHTHGEIMSYFTNDIDTLYNAMNDSFANIILSFCNIIGTIVMLFVINVPLTFIVLFFIVMMILFMVFNSRRAQRFYEEQQNSLSEVNSAVEEDISGAKVIRAFQREEYSFKRFDEKNKRWQRSSEKAFYHTQMNVPFFVSLSYLEFSIAAVVGIIFLCTGYFGEAGFGGLTSYLIYVRQSAQPFNLFSQQLNSILSAASGMERVFRFLDEEEEKDEGVYELKRVSDSNDSVERYAWVDMEHEDHDAVPLEGVIEFTDVSFSYVPGTPVVRRISFRVEPGQKVAFVGSTGAGKTTIMSLLSRFYQIDSGKITYDGIDIDDIKLESLRRALTMVTQDTHLFTDTIMDNIRYVRLHSTDEEVIEASVNSHADQFISKLPDGYQTIIHDDGSDLSEGQRQLLGLTRASLTRPPVMILDEATSNIDTRSEVLISDDLSTLMKDRSVLVIAHRLSTIRDADQILVLEKGEIIERGDQDELLKKRGLYYDLYTGKRELD